MSNRQIVSSLVRVGEDVGKDGPKVLSTQFKEPSHRTYQLVISSITKHARVPSVTESSGECERMNIVTRAASSTTVRISKLRNP